MTLEKLKALLESGAITQAEYDELAKNIQPIDPDPSADPNTEGDPTPTNESAKETIDYDKLDRIVQARVDKALATERKEKAELKKQLDLERRANKTDAELKQIEIEERERTIAEREKELQERLNREYAQKALREAGIDDGSETAFSLADFVMGENEDEIKGKVKTFKDLFDKIVAAEVDKRFKSAGYTPKQSSSLNGEKNPWAKGQENFTEQMRIEGTDPEKAARLKAAAGIN